MPACGMSIDGVYIDCPDDIPAIDATSTEPDSTAEPDTSPITSSASYIRPATGTASLATNAAPLNNQKTYNTALLSPEFAFKPLLDTSTIRKMTKTTTITTKPLATKEVQIIIPKKEEQKCGNMYNINKTFSGNLIDTVICNTQDYIKRLSKFL